MEFKEILRRRRSVRKYLSRPVEREVLDTVLREALAAPSSRNSHSTHLRVVTDPETIARIARMRDYGSAFLEHAPASYWSRAIVRRPTFWRENAAITATALLFAATDAGLASCWVHVNGRPCLKDRPDGAQAEDYLREFLPVPAEHGILCAVALGYSDFEPAALPPFDAGNAYPLAGKVAGSNRVRGGRVSGRTSFGRFMSLAGACIGNPAGFDFLGLIYLFRRRKSGSSNKKPQRRGCGFSVSVRLVISC